MNAPARLDPHLVTEVRSRLLEHWNRGHRDLPWRRTRDAYAILVAEVMLQQTRVETVVPYYERFLRVFPNLRALARAPLPRVLAAWSGLGYYRRARMLREAARTILSRHGGRFPETYEEVRALPGVGRYTAGALLSIAFGKPFPVLDGNVARVLSRLLAVRGDPRRNADRLWSAAASLVPPRAPGEFNQALMELGATVCTPRTPACPRCALRRICRARALGLQEKIPPRRRSSTRKVEWTSALVRRGSRVLLVRRPEGGLLAGMWELPTVESNGAHARASLARLLRDALGASPPLGPIAGVLRHGIEDRSITIRLLEAAAPSRAAPRRRNARWCTRSQAARLPLAAAARKSLRLLPLERRQTKTAGASRWVASSTSQKSSRR